MASTPKRGKIGPAGLVRPKAGLVDFVEALQAIDTTSTLAVLNATSIADNNGGRIQL